MSRERVSRATLERDALRFHPRSANEDAIASSEDVEGGAGERWSLLASLYRESLALAEALTVRSRRDARDVLQGAVTSAHAVLRALPRMGGDDVGPDEAFRGAIHDLKNLLNAVVIGAELSARQCDGEELDHVETVKVAVFRLAHRVDDFRAAFVSKTPALSAASAPARTR